MRAESYESASDLSLPARTIAGTRRPARLALFALAALLAAPLLGLGGLAHAQTTVWSATLTVKTVTSNLVGCVNLYAGSECRTTSVLTDDDFTYDSTDYTVTGIALESNGSLTIYFDIALTTAAQTLTLNVAGTPFAFEDTDGIESRRRRWNNSGLSWSAGDMVALQLIDTTPLPTLQSATVDGAYLTLAFDQALDRTSTPDGSAFTVMVGGTAATIGRVSIPRGGQGRVEIPLNPAAMAGQTVTVGYTAPGTGALRSEAGAAVAGFSGQAVTNETLPDTPPRLTVPEGGSAQFGFQFHTKPRHPGCRWGSRTARAIPI